MTVNHQKWKNLSLKRLKRPEKEQKGLRRKMGKRKARAMPRWKIYIWLCLLKKKIEVISWQCIGHPVAHNLWCIMHRSNWNFNILSPDICLNPFTSKVFNKISKFHFVKWWKTNSTMWKYCQRGFIWMVTARFYPQTQKLEPLYQTPSFTLTVKGFKLCPGSREFDLCLCGVGNLNWKFLVYFLCKMGWFTGQDLHRSVQTLSNNKKFRGSYCNYMQLFTGYSNEFHVIILA